MPTDDAERLEKLLDAAGRLVQPTQPGWQTLPQRLARTPQVQRGRFWPWLWLAPAPFGIAAAVALWVAFSSPKDLGTPTAQAEGLPVVVQRQDIELTVLSVAETEGETLYMPILPRLAQEPMAQPDPLMTGEPLSGPVARRGGIRPRPVRPPRKHHRQGVGEDRRTVRTSHHGARD